MKAIILAGGEGTRLRPVTGGKYPKPLAPLLSRPVMEHIVRLLRKNGVTEICAALHCMPEKISDYFGDGSSWDVHMKYHMEYKALGTAGSVRSCRDFWDGRDFLVVSGDAACDFDLRSLMEAHRRHEAVVTMALYPQDTPLSYGLVLTGPNGHVQSFIEKPSWDRVVTDLVNTGIYVISPKAMDYVPEGQPFDFARDLFPLLLKHNEPIFGLPMEGYWCDIGEPEAYYRCCLDALHGNLQVEEDDCEKPPEKPAEQPISSNAIHHSVRLTIDVPARARLMRALSANLMEAGADFTDGLRPAGKGDVHIAPLADREALSIEANDPDEAAHYEALTRHLTEEICDG